MRTRSPQSCQALFAVWNTILRDFREVKREGNFMTICPRVAYATVRGETMAFLAVQEQLQPVREQGRVLEPQRVPELPA